MFFKIIICCRWLSSWVMNKTRSPLWHGQCGWWTSLPTLTWLPFSPTAAFPFSSAGWRSVRHFAILLYTSFLPIIFATSVDMNFAFFDIFNMFLYLPICSMRLTCQGKSALLSLSQRSKGLMQLWNLRIWTQTWRVSQCCSISLILHNVLWSKSQSYNF